MLTIFWAAGATAFAQPSSTNVISGAISVPGERDGYTFSVTTSTRFYFDALTGPTGIRWSLAGPQGAVVTDRAFSGSDAQSIGYPLVNLPAGDYTLTVDGSGDTTNDYAFRFVKLVDATLLVPGSTVSGSLSPANETDFYQFTASAGDRFFFDQISRVSLPNTYWRLIDPYGNEIFTQGFTDVGTVAAPTTLPASGTYTVLVEGFIGDTGSGTYSFNVSPQGNTPQVPFAGTPFAVGDLVASNLVANTTNFHIFTLASASRLVFDTQTNSPNLNWTLEGPAGVAVNQRGLNSSDWANNISPLDLPAGSYQLRVRGNAAQPYRFRLLDLAAAPPITPGVTNNGALAPATEMDLFQFTASAGARFLFDALTQTGLPNAYWRLLDPFGGIVFNAGLAGDQGPLTLTASGAYTLLIEGYYAESGNGDYSFNVVPVTDGSQALALGSLVSGSVATPGQRQRYSFSLAASARLHFDSRTNLSLRWSLDGPAGNVVNNRTFSGSDGINIGYPLLNLGAGDYTLTVSGSGDNTGAYQFRLFDIATAAPLTPGAVVNGTLNPANETDAYQFNVAAPGKFFYDALTLTGAGNAYTRLFDQYGNLIFSTGLGGDFGPVNLQPGSYTLLIEGYHSDTGNGSYSFNFTPASDAAQPLVLGSLISGAITVPSQLQQYTFTLPAFARLHFDSRTNVALRWSLDGPTGNVINNRGFANSDGINIGYPLLNLPAGDYTLTVSGSGDNTGAYQFRLFDIATAAPMTPGVIVNGTLNPVNETDAYQFTVAAPGKYFYDALTLTGAGNAYARLFDQYGNLLFSTGLGSDFGPLNLPPGTYTLLVEGYHSDTGSGAYSFNLAPVTDAAQSLAVGSLTTGAIATPGQVQTYNFTLPAFARLYFDSRTNVALRWSLNGPTGNIINNRAFAGSDAQNIGNPLLNLLPGDYSLTVSGTGDSAGGYQFRLFDLGTATGITPGIAVNNTLNPANETDTYSFNVGVAGEFFFDYLSSTTLPNTWWRLIDPYGSILFSTSLGNDQGTFTLQPGAHTVLIEGYHSDAGSGSYSFNVVPVTDGSQSLALNTSVSGAIAMPGQQQRYTFILAAAARLYFDSLTNTSSMRWSLDGPAGNVVNNRGFGSSDAQNIGNPLLALSAGGYTLTVSGSGDQTGSYLFFLRDFAAATVLTPGVPVTVNNFPANQTALYRFTTGAGDRFFFDYQASTGLPNAYWRLFDPYNNLVFSRSFSTDAGTNILTAGVYTLLIEGYIGDGGQGSYTFNVRPEGNVPPAPFTGTPLAIGNTVTGVLATATTTNAHTFTLAAPARLYFDSLANLAANWSLNGPAGLIVDRRGFQGSDSADFGDASLALAAGDYQVTVTGAAGTYQFRLLDFASASAFTPGNVVSNTVSPARATVLYQFNGIAGDKFYFDGRPNTGFATQPYSRLYSPLGDLLFTVSANSDVDTFVLPQTGAYTVTVEGRYFDNNASGNYVFNLVPVTYGTNALTVGALVNGSIATPGQRQYYTLNLAADARLYFDALTNEDFSWRLDAPRGTVVDWRSFNSSDGADIANPMLNLPAGSYTMTVAWNNFTGTGDYSFRWLDFASSTPFTPGNVVSNTLAPARSTVFYRFTGTMGDKFYFDGRTSSGFQYQPHVRIYAPLGDIILAQGVNSDLDTFTLAQSGTYLVTVEGRIYDNNASGNYAFNLQPVAFGTNTLAIGALVNGSITTVGQRQYYNFTLPADARLYFDALTYADFSWRLNGPAGLIVDWRSFAGSDGADLANPMLTLPAGSYTMTVAWNNFTGTGDYSFRLLDFASSVAFTPGTVVSNALTPARSTVFYQFTGTAGDKFYFDGRTSSGFTYAPQVRLYGPLQNILFSLGVSSDLDTFTLPQSGTYLVTVEGRIYDDSASGNYSFNFVPVSDGTNALAIGALVNGSITTVGQRQYYNFTLPADARLYFDALTNANFSWRLNGPAGLMVDWRSFNGSDGADFANPMLTLPAGSYTLTVAWNNFTGTGDYSFRLLDFADSTPFTPGNVVSNTLAPARSTVFYRFTGAVGDKYYFDGRASSGFTYQPQVRLYAPLGNIEFSQGANSDVDTFTLTQSGIYTLTVEGRIYDDNASGNYAFNLAPNPDQPSTPLFQTNNSPDLVVTTVAVVPPSGLQSGDSATVQWMVQNSGGVATSGSFTDRVIIRNAATGLIVANSTLAYNEGDAGNGPIAPNAVRARQLSVTLPDGTNAVGTLEVTVTTDTLNNIAEQNSGGTGEANNSTSITINTTLAPYPDLLVHGITATPATGWIPGTNVTLQWRLTNAGPRATSGNWTDSVLVRNTNTLQVLANTTTNYVQADAGSGPIAPGGFRDRSITFTVPNNANAYGGFEIIVTADSASQLFELNATGTAELNNSRTLQTFSAPDLRVTGLNVTASPALQSGASLTINWNIANDGNVESGGGFSDRIFVRNTTTAEVLLDTTLFYNPATAGNGPIPPGGSRPRTRQFTLPDGPPGAGNLEITVTADSFNQLLELNSGGTGEANNSATVNAATTLAPYPDLRVVNLTVEPAAIASGTNVTIRWQNTNSGVATAAGNWSDRVTIVNTNTGATLLDTTVFYNSGSLGPITNGTARDRSHNFTLPNNAGGAGGLIFTVTADTFNNVFEYNPGGTGESNNAASLVRVAGLSPLPDLAVHDILAPAAGLPGQPVQLVYVITNRGTATAAGPWNDNVFLSGDLVLGSDIFLGNFNVTNSIPAGGSLSRTQSVTVPVNGDAGNLHFVVATDAGNAVTEQDNANNTLLDADNFSVPLTLTLTLSANQIAENAANPNLFGTVTRNGSRNAALTVNLASGDSSEIVVPVSVVIGVGQVTANFNATVQQDGIYDGNQVVTLTASAAGFPPVGTNITVIEGNIPFLTLTLAATNVVEGSNFTATVTRDPSGPAPLTVQLNSSDVTQLSVPSTVQIAGGAASFTFGVTAVNDTLVERTNSYTLTATASGFISDAASVRIEDDDIPNLVVTLAADTVSEGAGPNATSGTVTRSFPGGRGLVVRLVSGDTSVAQVPSNITIPAGATSAVFSVSVVNNTIVDGPRAVAIGALVLESNTGVPLREAAPDALTVTDDDGPTLTLTVAAAVVGEGLNPATTGTVRRNTSTNAPLVVGLVSSDTTEATVPPTVTIPAGSAAATFNIASVSDGATDGNQTVALTASAAGFTDGTDTFVVSDSDLPDLLIGSLAVTNSALTEQNISARLRLENRGLLGASNSIVQRVFISSDPVAGGDVLGAQVDYTGPLGVGQFVDQTVTLRMPAAPGNYWIVVQADVNDAVFELLEDNNTFVTATPIVVQPSYTATLATAITTALANTPVPMSGQATYAANGSPAGSVPVTIHVVVRGVRRTFTVITGADGRFNYTFQPLPNEAGVYGIAAAHPGVVNPASQDTFTLLGLSLAPVGLVNVIEGGSISNSTRLDNLSDVPLTGLTAVVVTNQPNLTVTVEVSTNTLGGFGTASLNFTIAAADATVFQSPVVLRVTSAEGVTAEVILTVRVEALRPRLSASPASLIAAMRRGVQTTVAFTVDNQGGLATGPLEVVLPSQPWLALVSPAQLPPLPAGSNTTVTVLLTPAADLSLGDYTGTLVVRSSNSALNVPFSFRAVSDAKGDLRVVAEDEYTYFAAGSPRVTNATVILTDALSGAGVVTNFTGADGSVLFTNLNEAYYIVDVRADGHSSFRESALVAAGQTTNVVAFLPRQTVRYTFTVEPTTIEDRYTFSVESVFETQVPIPVVTISPASIDLAQFPGDEFQIEYTVRNHGLIAADHVKINIPSTDRLQFTPLISEIGRLAPNASLTIPVLVRRLDPAVAAAGGEPRFQAAGHETGQCSVTAQMLWDYLCGPNVVNKDTAFYAFDSTGCDLVDLYFQVYDLVPDGPPGPGPVLTTGEFVDYLNQFQPVSGFEAPPGYKFQCKDTPPGGAPFGAASTTVRPAPFRAAAGPNEVCARVALRLDQRAVLARDAFKATLEIDNDTTSPLQNVLVNLDIKDRNGVTVNSTFGIRDPELTGLTDIDGTGSLAGNTSGRANWILIPTLDAAPTNGFVVYLVGGTLSYVQDGTSVTIPLAPAPIQVFPQPELLVRYFHERDVFSDDPFTLEVEPSLPYALAVQIANVGYGAARSLKLSGGKPEIVDNEKSLLIEFQAIATALENQPLSPALEVDFGRIEPGTNKIARWLFTSSLQGSFTNFSASFQHQDALGARRLSLVRGTEIHELSHIVQADRAFEDHRPDLLVNDAPDSAFLPDTLYLSDGGIVPVSAVTNVAVNGVLSSGSLSVIVNATAPAGWSYFRFANPGNGDYRITQVRRADNSIVALGTNVWTTDRFFRGGELRPIKTNLVHLLDHDSTGSYTLVFEPIISVTDTNPPTSAAVSLPASSGPDFIVTWSGSDGVGGTGVAFYDVYVSNNGGPFIPWVTNTLVTGALYSGTVGSSYSFYSRATDGAGNAEAAPAGADAQTTVAPSGNVAPAFAPVTPLVAPEGSLFSFTPAVTDVNVPAQTITFSLLPGSPVAALFSPANGRITWQTGEADGGSSFTLRIVATDNGSPSLAATQSVTLTISEANTAPAIAPVAAQYSLNEETGITLDLNATDTDLPAQTLTWQLATDRPAGMSIDAATGVITWTPTEEQGPGTNIVTVMVSDNGSPNASESRTISFVVNEVNRPPVLAAISNHVAYLLTRFTLTNEVADADLPANRFTFTLGPGAPAGARINPTNGVFSWTPTRAQAPSTNAITITVNDNGLPALTDTKSFTIVVGDFLEVSLGSTIVQDGLAGSVPVRLTTSSAVTNVSVLIEAPADRIGNLAFTPNAALSITASLQSISPGLARLQVAAGAGQPLMGGPTLGQLGFVAVTNQSSAFVPLKAASPQAMQANGALVPNVLAQDGRVVVVGAELLLEIVDGAGGQRDLILYGDPGRAYSLESTPSLNPPTLWTPGPQGTLSGLFQTFPNIHSNAPAMFFRARE